MRVVATFLAAGVIALAPTNTATRERLIAVYPTGVCDNIKAGMPGLNDFERAPARTTQIGTSVEGRPIFAEYWGEPNETTIYVIVAQIHGDECSPTLVADEVRRAGDLGYGVWLIPTLNPDGYANNTRKNSNGVDLNRDGGATQPETKALFRLVGRVEPTAVIQVHGPNAFIGTYGGAKAKGIASRVARTLGFLLKDAGDHRNFLWVGLKTQLDAQSILVEIHRVAWNETPDATPLPEPRKVGVVREEARLTLAALSP